MTSHQVARTLGLAIGVALHISTGCDLASLVVTDEHTFRSESPQAIGELSWEILECRTGTILARSTRTVLARDVAITRMRDAAGVVSFDKRIDLESGFYIVLVEYPEESPSDLTGFALNANRDGVGAFSWDWFRVEHGTRAVKIRESGELDFSQVAVGPRWEIGRTEVTSPVSLRVTLFDSIGGVRDEPEWRVQLGKGSHITWPSVVDDLVICTVPITADARPN